MPKSVSSLPVEPVPRALRSPRWWPAWVGLGLMRLVACLPMSLTRALGMMLGDMFHALSPARRRIVRTNLRLCFPEMGDDARRRLARAHFRALGIGLFELLLAWFASDRRLRRVTSYEGVEHLQAAEAAGGGTLLLTGHFTTMELGCRLAHLAGLRFHGMYRHADNLFVDYWMRRLRESRVDHPMFPKDDLRQIVRTLRQGGQVWYAPDQALEVANTRFVDFFGQPARTLTATSRLAQMGHARVVPYFPQRRHGRYHIVFLPALENFPSDDEVADARRINALLESAIRAVPEQYFWVHRRFKDGPPGQTDPYGC